MSNINNEIIIVNIQYQLFEIYVIGFIGGGGSIESNYKLIICTALEY